MSARLATPLPNGWQSFVESYFGYSHGGDVVGFMASSFSELQESMYDPLVQLGTYFAIRSAACFSASARCCHWALMLFTLLGVAHLTAGDEPTAPTLASLGIRALEGMHLTLYTDLPSEAEVDGLPKVFDLAVPQWADFFGVSIDRLKAFHVTGCVMRDKTRFERCGLLSSAVPAFENGIQVGDRIWLNEQPSAYYRRHLVLHEGTHAVMNFLFGRVGPVWYREGVAELLGTHQLVGGQLMLAHFPQNREEVPYWGRIKLLQDAAQQGQIRSIPAILTARPREFADVQLYAWAWGLTTFTKQRAPEVWDQLKVAMSRSDDEVTATMRAAYRQNSFAFEANWRLFLQHLNYGYDGGGEQFPMGPNSEHMLSDTAAETQGGLEDGEAKRRECRVAANRGWQLSGIFVAKGDEIEFRASGRYLIGRDPKSWWCEPQGVTIEYYQGKPLGMLLGAVVDRSDPGSAKSLAQPLPVGREFRWTADADGELFFRINERGDQISDNRGELTVTVVANLVASEDGL